VAPIVDAGEPQNASVGDTVTLVNDSKDLLNEPLSYLWTAPAGITLSDNAIKQPAFTVPNGTKAGDLVFKLTVDDGKSVTSTDNVTITIENSIPLA